MQQACVVSGVLADANGNAISDANEYISVKFINKNRADRYGREWTWASVDSKGAISATLPAGTYDVEASYTCGVTEATKYLYNVVIDTTKSGFDIKLPLYKFTVYSGEEGVLKNFGNWNDVYGDTYAYGNTIYLKEGTYNLTYKYGDDNRWGDSTGKDWLTASVSVTVPSASAQSFVTAQINYAQQSVALGQNTCAANKKGTAYVFVPAEDGYYDFSVLPTNADVYVYGLDTTGSFGRISYLKANQKYFVVVTSSVDQNVTVTIEKQ